MALSNPAPRGLVVQDRIWAIDRRANDDAFNKPPFCENGRSGLPLPDIAVSRVRSQAGPRLLARRIASSIVRLSVSIKEGQSVILSTASRPDNERACW